MHISKNTFAARLFCVCVCCLPYHISCLLIKAGALIISVSEILGASRRAAANKQ